MLLNPALNWTAPKVPLITNSYMKFKKVVNSNLNDLS